MSGLAEKIDGAVRGLERIKADFGMRGANAVTIERAIHTLKMEKEFADEITRLTARVAELEGALRPFANDASAWTDFDGCEPLIELWPGGPESALQVSDLRDARAALEPKP